MKDTVIKGTGNSRFLKSVENFKSLYPTYDAFVEALVAGTLPIDFNGVNPDGITQLGTPLSMGTLLKHVTAAVFGLGEEAVPDDVLRTLSRFQSGLCNEYVWAKYADGQVAYIKESTTVTRVITTAAGNYTLAASTSVAIENGKVVLVNPGPVLAENLAGYYIEYNGTIYRLDSMSDGSDTYIGWNGYAQSVEYAAGVVGYVNSPDINTYPPAEDDGFIYEYLGRMGEKTRIAYGSYTGTGKIGASNPNSLTFDFEPKAVWITSNTWGIGGRAWLRGVRSGAVTTDQSCTLTWNGNALSWYNSSNEAYQLNSNTVVYYYVAIG